MKKTNFAKTLLAVLLCALLAFSFAACNTKTPDTDVSSAPATTASSVWDNALYSKDTALGEGNKTITVKVVKDNQTLTFTLKTDGKTLADALKETKLVEGEEGQYGLYIKKVNGISGVYEIDNAYWSIEQNGAPTPTGADGIEIAGGESFELVYTKA